MRPGARQAAKQDPMAIEIEKTARKTTTTSSLAPSTVLTRTGISDSATAPTSQNQLVATAPQRGRGSCQSSLRRPAVERAILGSIRRLGAPWPVRGVSRLAPQHRTSNTVIERTELA